jgi:hypothetical protein
VQLQPKPLLLLLRLQRLMAWFWGAWAASVDHCCCCRVLLL